MPAEDRSRFGFDRRLLLRAGLIGVGGACLGNRARSEERAQQKDGGAASGKGEGEEPLQKDRKLIGKICPYALVGIINGIYYYYALDFDEDPPGTCTHLGNEYEMTSATMLNEGCGDNPHCVIKYEVAGKDGVKHRFAETSQGKLARIVERKNHVPPMGDTPEVGLSRTGRLSNNYRFNYDPRRIKLIEVSDYQVGLLQYKIRLFLILYRPPDDPKIDGTPLLLCVGQELNVRRTGGDPGLGAVEMLGDRYCKVYREEDDMEFHVLTYSNILTGKH